MTTNHDCYIHSGTPERRACGSTTVVPPKSKAKIAAMQARGKAIEFLVCAGCWESFPAAEFRWPDGKRVGA